MSFVILESKARHPSSKRLARDPETRNVLAFDSEGDARSYIETYRKNSNWRVFYPDYEVWEASDLRRREWVKAFSTPFEDNYTSPRTWRALARAVARTLRHDPEALFEECWDEVVGGPAMFGLEVLVPYSQVLVDVAELEGREWWEYLDFSPRYRWVEGSFDEPEDLFELADILNWMSDHNGLQHLDLSNLPTFGGKKPENTQGVLSWDEDVLLVQGSSGFEVVTREEWTESD